MNGKGSKPRNCFSEQYRRNYDAIDWGRACTGWHIGNNDYACIFFDPKPKTLRTTFWPRKTVLKWARGMGLKVASYRKGVLKVKAPTTYWIENFSGPIRKAKLRKGSLIG
jgi:hypothetical protein